MTGRRFTYILPIRRTTPASTEFTDYLTWIGRRCQLVVVDGSPPDVFAEHHLRWSGLATHVPVAADVHGPNGKARGVLTGLRFAEQEMMIIADDDVRYDAASIESVLSALEHAHVVRPQNFTHPLPWHAIWDSGRILLNRALDGDWPGTLGVRRSALRATNGYADDVLFENLELVRTVVAAGGTERLAADVFVRRLPPTGRHFWSQRVRQAYDEFARPRRMAIQLSLLPMAIGALFTVPIMLAYAAAGTVMIAEYGRKRDNGRHVFPPIASLAAPAWVAERAICAWLALLSRARHGGVVYNGGVIVKSATSMTELRRRHSGAITSTSMGLNVPLLDNSAEQAVTPTT